MNQTLRKEHLLQQDYYKELLDVQSCGVMAYTLPGHRIVHMNAEALRMYGYYDLILMDVQMPRMNGYDATRQIRKLRDQKKASIPVIVMTANAFEEDRNEAFAAGMDEHVAKSVEIINFAKTMKDDIMSISEQEKAQLFQCERRMAIMIAAKQLQAPKVPIMV